MEVPEAHPCDDELCAVFITESGNPFVCLHYDDNIEAIDYWGRVARNEISVDDVIEPYRQHLNFDEATSLSDHFDDEECEWKGPTEEIEVRANNDVVNTFTVYPHDSGRFPGFEAAKLYAEGFAEGYYARAIADEQTEE